MKKNEVIWIAHCLTCNTRLEACANGQFAEAAAKMHINGSMIGSTIEMFQPHPGHEVLVGYAVVEVKA